MHRHSSLPSEISQIDKLRLLDGTRSFLLMSTVSSVVGIDVQIGIRRFELMLASTCSRKYDAREPSRRCRLHCNISGSNGQSAQHSFEPKGREKMFWMRTCFELYLRRRNLSVNSVKGQRLRASTREGGWNASMSDRPLSTTWSSHPLDGCLYKIIRKFCDCLKFLL